MKTILLVEDDEGIRDALTIIFTHAGYHVDAYLCNDYVPPDGYEKADIIFLNVMLPGLNGLQICQKLKSSDRTRHIPVILLSASPRKKFAPIEEFCEDEFIEKPFEARKLLHILKKYTLD